MSVKRPVKHARVALWRAYAIGQGMSKADAAAATKAQLVEAFTTNPEPPAPLDEHLERGEVEASTFRDLRAAGLHTMALAKSAFKLARCVDEADSAAAATVAARELRMTLATVRSLGKPLSPHSGSDSEDEGDGVVVGADRLNAARERSQHARKGTAR